MPAWRRRLMASTHGPILGAEREKTPPDEGEVLEIHMSPCHRAHPYCSATDGILHVQIAAFLVRQARRCSNSARGTCV